MQNKEADGAAFDGMVATFLESGWMVSACDPAIAASLPVKAPAPRGLIAKLCHGMDWKLN
jgi:hypothetical protein